jgi:hypothetical protein
MALFHLETVFRAADYRVFNYERDYSETVIKPAPRQTSRLRRSSSELALKGTKVNVACSLAPRTYDFLDSIFGKSKFIEKTRFKKKRDFLGDMP